MIPWDQRVRVGRDERLCSQVYEYVCWGEDVGRVGMRIWNGWLSQEMVRGEGQCSI
jgi:hypothetical protein